MFTWLLVSQIDMGLFHDGSVIAFLDVIQTWCKEMERKTVLVNTAAIRRDGEKRGYKNYNIIT